MQLWWNGNNMIIIWYRTIMYLQERERDGFHLKSTGHEQTIKAKRWKRLCNWKTNTTYYILVKQILPLNNVAIMFYHSLTFSSFFNRQCIISFFFKKNWWWLLEKLNRRIEQLPHNEFHLIKRVNNLPTPSSSVNSLQLLWFRGF